MSLVEANASVEGRSALAAEGGPETNEKPDIGPREARRQDGADKPAPQTEQTGFKATIKKHPIAAVAFAVALIVAIAAAIVWCLHERHFESTDDAFIDGRPVLISPQVTGNIVLVNVTDNQRVKAGDLLAKIDPRDYQAAVDQADAQFRQAQANVNELAAQIVAQASQIEEAEKQVAGAQASLNFAQDENNRYQDLVQKGAGTVQRAQQASADFDSKRAALEAASAGKISAQRRIAVLQAQKSAAEAQVDNVKAQRTQANVNLGRTELRATVDGRIAKLTAAVGALATSAQSIMVLVPLDAWVTANFKESQLADMRVGQTVDINIDAYRRTFPGHVDSVQAGSGTAFSLLPAENATGNYVKVVQRVPVKIVFDQRPDVDLGPGMSVVPTVTVRP